MMNEDQQEDPPWHGRTSMLPIPIRNWTSCSDRKRLSWTLLQVHRATSSPFPVPAGPAHIARRSATQSILFRWTSSPDPHFH